DAVRAEVAAERLGQHADRALGAAVRGLARRADVRRDRAHAADRAAVALADHSLGALGADYPGTADGGLEQLVEVVQAGVVPGHQWVDGRVGYHVVEPAAALGHGAHHPGRVFRVAHVRGAGERLPAGLLDPAERLRRVGGGQRVDAHQRAL